MATLSATTDFALVAQVAAIAKRRILWKFMNGYRCVSLCVLTWRQFHRADEKSSLKGPWSGSCQSFQTYTTWNISRTAKARDFKFCIRVGHMWSISLVMTGCPLSGRRQGHVCNFYIKISPKHWCNQQTRRRSACGLHLQRSSASWLNAHVYYTLVNCNPLTPLLRFVLDLLYKLFLHCCAAVGKIFFLIRRVARSVCDSRASCLGLRRF